MRLTIIFKFVMLFQIFYSFNANADTCIFGSLDGTTSNIVNTEKIHINKVEALNTVWADPTDIEFYVEKCVTNNDTYYSLATKVTPTRPGKTKGASRFDIAVIQDNKQFDGLLYYSDNLYVPTDFWLGLSSLTTPDLNLTQPFTLIFSCAESTSSDLNNACNAVNPEFYFTLDPQSANSSPTISSINGSWYDPNYNGSGFNIVQTPVGLILYYYGYKANADGEALWLISSLGPKTIAKEETFVLDMSSGFVGNGGSLTTKPNTTNSGTTSWGTAEVTFNSCNSGVIKLTNNNGVIVTHNITLLAGVEELTCRD